MIKVLWGVYSFISILILYGGLDFYGRGETDVDSLLSVLYVIIAVGMVIKLLEVFICS